MKTDELREMYLAFFESKGHSRQDSDVLVPTWDPSVLFTPAGMNQFKDHFLGKVKLEFTRATTCQKCLRTGDIDNVGRNTPDPECRYPGRQPHPATVVLVLSSGVSLPQERR